MVLAVESSYCSPGLAGSSKTAGPRIPAPVSPALAGPPAAGRGFFSGVTGAGVDGTPDAGLEGMADAGPECVPDAGREGATDAGLDGMADAGPECVPDAGWERVPGACPGGVPGMTCTFRGGKRVPGTGRTSGVMGAACSGTRWSIPISASREIMSSLPGIRREGTIGILSSSAIGYTDTMRLYLKNIFMC